MVEEPEIKHKTKPRSTFRIILDRLKKAISLKSLIILIVLLSMNTYAWFLYVSQVSTGISTTIRAWKVKFEYDDEEVSEEIFFNISDLYPGMLDISKTAEITNYGEVSADFSFTINYIEILGDRIELDQIVGGEVVDTDYLVDYLKTTYPFIIDVSSSGDSINAGQTGYLYINASWDYESGDDELDTLWGQRAYDYKATNIDEAIKISIKIKVKQHEENTSSEEEDPEPSGGDVVEP